MTLKKLKDLPNPCLCREHDPPTHSIFDNGVYEWTCPACKEIQEFTVRHPSWSANNSKYRKTYTLNED